MHGFIRLHFKKYSYHCTLKKEKMNKLFASILYHHHHPG